MYEQLKHYISILQNTKNKKNVSNLNGSPGSHAENNQAGPEKWFDY